VIAEVSAINSSNYNKYSARIVDVFGVNWLNCGIDE